MKARDYDLLMAAKEALDDGHDPFHHGFLNLHDVTLEESVNMGDNIAAAIELYLGFVSRG